MTIFRIGLRVATVAAAAHIGLALAVKPAAAEEGLQPGEAYVTRFSGITTEGGPAAIDVNGTVGSVIDVRAPGQPPKGEHWIDEPQRNAITAAETGQVFGVALDDNTPPNIYVTATSAFGLHLAPGTQQWMDGMWGQGGGPGSIYKISGETDWKPQLLTNVTLNGRANTGPALGNIAFDKASKKLFVSDLETGMIHRIDPTTGRDLGTYDHGSQGRPRFFDAENNKQGSLPAITFNPGSRARIADCSAGPFERTPACWNFAASGRRVWGLGVRRDAENGSRLYYAVWSGPAFGQTTWSQGSEDDKRNSVWSVRLGEDGSFDPSNVRRELIVPDFFTQASPRAGYSQPVSDISFSECGERPVMLLGERGGIRNLGLDKDNAFAYPHEARALRYELDQSGAWRPVGRYDIGFHDRRKEGAPYIRSNCSGGIAFGLGYDESTWTASQGKPDQFVWSTGDYLCSPEGPCHLPPAVQTSANENGISPASAQEQEEGDDSHVHGVQGMAESAFEQLLPAGALGAEPGNASPASGPDQSYLIDTDINVDEQGGLIPEELTRNDATRIGDVAIYQVCAKPRRPTPQFLLPPPPATATGWVPDEPPEIEGHSRSETHAQVASHGSETSHYRWGSHNPWWSHGRWRSHNRHWSHNRHGSHNPRWSHARFGSHSRRESHDRHASHHRSHSHFQEHSHASHHSHHRFRSHNSKHSLGHLPRGSHNKIRSHSGHKPIGSHNRMLSHSGHKPHGSHTKALSGGTHHDKLKSGGTHHNVVQSKGGHHSIIQSKGTHHNAVQSKGGHHNVIQSKNKFHNAAKSSGTTLIHNQAMSKGGHHNAVQSKGNLHNVAKSKGTHAHNAALSKGTIKQHSVLQSKAKLHSVAQSSAKTHTKGPHVTKTPVVKTHKVIKTPVVKTHKVIKTTPKVHTQKVIKTHKVHTPKVVHKPVKMHTPKVHKPVVRSAPKVRAAPKVVRSVPAQKKKH